VRAIQRGRQLLEYDSAEHFFVSTVGCHAVLNRSSARDLGFLKVRATPRSPW
jgi:hypothetical protein